jgi:glutamine amidotransferase of anthranilate synthase or aminodeoxychorismate synthase
MILMIDNYDSFTFNLVQYLGELHGDIQVFRNDKISIPEIKKLKPKAIVISPGPCTPREAGISVEVVKQLGPTVPLLGVCLGHQSIGYAFGGTIVRAPYLMHGKVSEIHHDGKRIYSGVPNPFIATRYHSLIIERLSCPECLEITAQTSDGIIMGVRHKKYPIEGVQFHPESILTQSGKTLLKNFLSTI